MTLYRKPDDQVRQRRGSVWKNKTDWWIACNAADAEQVCADSYGDDEYNREEMGDFERVPDDTPIHVGFARRDDAVEELRRAEASGADLAKAKVITRQRANYWLARQPCFVGIEAEACWWVMASPGDCMLCSTRW